jgi:hypothetical protein
MGTKLILNERESEVLWIINIMPRGDPNHSIKGFYDPEVLLLSPRRDFVVIGNQKRELVEKPE